MSGCIFNCGNSGENQPIAVPSFILFKLQLELKLFSLFINNTCPIIPRPGIRGIKNESGESTIYSDILQLLNESKNILSCLLVKYEAKARRCLA